MGTAVSKPSTELLSAWLEIHPRIGVSLMDHLWNRLDGAYPNRWRAAFANEQAVQNWREAWAEAFVEEGIAPAEVKDAIARCRKSYDWPPSLSEFIKACRPPLDYEAAHAEAVKQMRARADGADAWSDPAIYWAAAEIGEFDLRSLAYPVIKGRWKDSLNKAIDGIKAGTIPNEVPKRSIALPAPGKTVAAPEQARKHLAVLRGKFRSGVAAMALGGVSARESQEAA